MTTLQIILGSVGALVCLVWFICLKVQPKDDRDCVYKVPGFWRKK